MRELDFVEPAEVGMDSERLEAGRRLMDDQFERGASPILVAVVARSGKVVFSHCRGLARPGGDHVTVDSVFPLNSATKSMTAAVLMTLVEEGRVGITDRVVDYIPELDACDNDGVLLHHLLTHTAGWDSEAILARRESLVASGDLGTPPSGMDMMQHVMLNLYWDIPRSRPAGEAMVYETWNYGLLGEIIRRVTGVSLHAAMTERLFKPLGMTRSAVIVRDDLEPRVIERPHGIPLAEGHGAFTPARAPSMLVCDDGSFGGHASALDMVRFGQLFLNGGVVDGQRLLSQASIRVMTTNQIPGTPSALLGRVFARPRGAMASVSQTRRPGRRSVELPHPMVLCDTAASEESTHGSTWNMTSMGCTSKW